jgi:hypothetical protein
MDACIVAAPQKPTYSILRQATIALAKAASVIHRSSSLSDLYNVLQSSSKTTTATLSRRSSASLSSGIHGRRSRCIEHAAPPLVSSHWSQSRVTSMPRHWSIAKGRNPQYTHRHWAAPPAGTRRAGFLGICTIARVPTYRRPRHGWASLHHHWSQPSMHHACSRLKHSCPGAEEQSCHLIAFGSCQPANH